MPTLSIDTRFCYYYHIKVTDYILMQSKTLSDLAFDKISADRRFDMFA
jgi:hypothetical protein